jgi:cell division protease FtsH
VPTEEKHSRSKNEYLNMITMAMGGRASDVLVYNVVDTGAGGDIKNATRMAHEFVCSYGMSDKLGLVNWGGAGQEMFLGRDFLKEKNYSEETANMIDREVKSIIEKAYNNAFKILKTRRKFLDIVAKNLISKETIDGIEFEKMYEEYTSQGRKKNKKAEDGQKEDKKSG